LTNTADSALDEVERELPRDFPEQIHRFVKAGVTERLRRLALL
jgi:hypothetical protein